MEDYTMDLENMVVFAIENGAETLEDVICHFKTEFVFVDEEDVFRYMEGLTRHIFETVSKINLPDSFPRITYQEAMETYGSD